MAKLKYDADIFDAIEFGDIETVKLFWTKHIDINFQEKNGSTMLMLAVAYGDKQIVKFLLSKGPNLAIRNNDGKTAIGIAEENGRLEILDLLSQYKK
ncbi:MAG: ankyrin repeat domain-containing protein [Chitinophagales bacterium]|nr:ankyrin repeat domain-containing protein [Chitinophagales bacterium]